MFNSIKAVALSAAIGIGALAAGQASAHADDFYPNGRSHHDRRVGVQIGDDGYRVEYRGNRWDEGNRWDRDGGWDRNNGWGRDGGWRRARGCSAERALGKAEMMGLRRARIVDISRHTISIKGRKWDQRMIITFARAPHCPIIR